MRVRVLTDSETTGNGDLFVDLPAGATTRELQDAIESKLRIPRRHQDLFSMGRRLETSCGLQRGACIHLRVKPGHRKPSQQRSDPNIQTQNRKSEADRSSSESVQFENEAISTTPKVPETPRDVDMELANKLKQMYGKRETESVSDIESPVALERESLNSQRLHAWRAEVEDPDRILAHRREVERNEVELIRKTEETVERIKKFQHQIQTFSLLALFDFLFVFVIGPSKWVLDENDWQANALCYMTFLHITGIIYSLFWLLTTDLSTTKSIIRMNNRCQGIWIIWIIGFFVSSSVENSLFFENVTNQSYWVSTAFFLTLEMILRIFRWRQASRYLEMYQSLEEWELELGFKTFSVMGDLIEYDVEYDDGPPEIQIV